MFLLNYDLFFFDTLLIRQNCILPTATANQFLRNDTTFFCKLDYLQKSQIFLFKFQSFAITKKKFYEKQILLLDFFAPIFAIQYACYQSVKNMTSND